MQTLLKANAASERPWEAPLAASDRTPSPERIREQLSRILASPRFVSSPRCQHLLKFLVEASLNGQAEHLKERNLGIEVFRRDPDYDTNADPVVRVAVSEIRKKLAQFYYEADDQDRVRIELHAGSYAPYFSQPNHAGNSAVPAEGTALSTPSSISQAPGRTRGMKLLRPRVFKIGALAAACLLGSGGLFMWHARAAVDPEAMFWEPAVKSPDPILLCIGQLIATSFQLDADTARNPEGSTMPIATNASANRGMPVAVMDDSITLANVASLLRAKDKSFVIRSEANTSYEDMQKGPAVLVGALNNDWTMRLMRPMRFQFHSDTQTMEWWVSDQKNPGVKLGVVNVRGSGIITKDLAVVARFIDPETRQPTIIVAGLTPPGTLAAGEFVSDPQRLAEYMRNAPSGWLSKNVEILLSVDVVDGQPGPARVIDTAIW